MTDEMYEGINFTGQNYLLIKYLFILVFLG